MTQASDVLIVGAGLVGLSLAAALQTSGCGLKIKIVDARDKPELPVNKFKSREDHTLRSGIASRVSSINPGSKKFLDRIGAWERISESTISPFQQMHVWDGQGTSHIEFGDSDSGALGYIVENERIVEALLEVLSDSTSIEFHWQTRLSDLSQDDEGYSLTLEDGTKIHTGLLVGADGGNSIVRELCNIRTVKWSYEQTALVTTVETELAHGQVARQCFTKDGPLAFLPLSDEHFCSIVWSVREVDRLLALTDAEFCALVGSAFENRLGEIRGVDQRFSFPLVQQHALQYVGEHVALIGDAAHTIHPLAGQGANLGFADARVLAQILAGAKLEGRKVEDKSLLNQYQRQRRTENVPMAVVMETFKRLYNTDNPGVNWLRNTGMRMINGNENLKSMITRLAAAD
jgi:2-octaprenylphenol hydroxylase